MYMQIHAHGKTINILGEMYHTSRYHQEEIFMYGLIFNNERNQNKIGDVGFVDSN